MAEANKTKTQMKKEWTKKRQEFFAIMLKNLLTLIFNIAEKQDYRWEFRTKNSGNAYVFKIILNGYPQEYISLYLYKGNMDIYTQYLHDDHFETKSTKTQYYEYKDESVELDAKIVLKQLKSDLALYFKEIIRKKATDNYCFDYGFGAPFTSVYKESNTNVEV